jgi:hypothetical protein
MNASFRTGGFCLAMLALSRIAWGSRAWLQHLPQRMRDGANVGVPERAERRQQTIADRATMFSPCWQLSYCREVIRVRCPAFVAKTKCWKFGRGCYCDSEMITRIINGETLSRIQAPSQLTRMSRPPCGSCYIYLEHQAHKLRWLSPLLIPVTIGVMFLLWPLYRIAFQGVAKLFSGLWQAVAFVPPPTYGPPPKNTFNPIPTGQITPEQAVLIAQNMCGVILGFFVLIYLLRLLEWALYKRNW